MYRLTSSGFVARCCCASTSGVVTWQPCSRLFSCTDYRRGGLQGNATEKLRRPEPPGSQRPLLELVLVRDRLLLLAQRRGKAAGLAQGPADRRLPGSTRRGSVLLPDQQQPGSSHPPPPEPVLRSAVPRIQALGSRGSGDCLPARLSCYRQEITAHAEFN